MEREKTERKVGLLLSLTFVRPTIGVEPCFVVYTYFHYRLERDFKRSHTLHECKEQLYGVQALYTTTIKCAIKCLIAKLTLHLFTLKCLAIFRRLLENTWHVFSLRHLSQKQNYSNITIFSWKYLATHKKVLIIHYQTLRYKLQPFKCTFLGVNQSNTCSLLSKKLLFCCFKATLLLIKKVFWPKFAQKWQSVA